MPRETDAQVYREAMQPTGAPAKAVSARKAYDAHPRGEKRLLVHAGPLTLGLLIRQQIGAGTPRGFTGGPSPARPPLWCCVAPSGPMRVQSTSHDARHRVSVVQPRSTLIVPGSVSEITSTTTRRQDKKDLGRLDTRS